MGSSALLSSCTSSLGCAATATPLQCSCVQICTEPSLRWAIVASGHLAALHVVGECDALHSWPDATLVDRARRAASIEVLPPASPPPHASPPPPSQEPPPPASSSSSPPPPAWLADATVIDVHSVLLAFTAAGR